ncbi:hypothetical protein C8R45DRAFT_948447 [Mycena sanguinolenta]|nr:hypothetical protein C8R45DRAFT_948447 [Mycena sanguinolenta]
MMLRVIDKHIDTCDQEDIDAAIAIELSLNNKIGTESSGDEPDTEDDLVLEIVTSSNAEDTANLLNDPVPSSPTDGCFSPGGGSVGGSSDSDEFPTKLVSAKFSSPAPSPRSPPTSDSDRPHTPSPFHTFDPDSIQQAPQFSDDEVSYSSNTETPKIRTYHSATPRKHSLPITNANVDLATSSDVSHLSSFPPPFSPRRHLHLPKLLLWLNHGLNSTARNLKLINPRLLLSPVVKTGSQCLSSLKFFGSLQSQNRRLFKFSPVLRAEESGCSFLLLYVVVALALELLAASQRELALLSYLQAFFHWICPRIQAVLVTGFRMVPFSVGLVILLPNALLLVRPQYPRVYAAIIDIGHQKPSEKTSKTGSFDTAVQSGKEETQGSRKAGDFVHSDRYGTREGALFKFFNQLATEEDKKEARQL